MRVLALTDCPVLQNAALLASIQPTYLPACALHCSAAVRLDFTLHRSICFKILLYQALRNLAFTDYGSNAIYNLAAYRLLKPLSSFLQHLVNISMHVCRHLFSIRVVQPQYGVPFRLINYALAHSWRAFTCSYTTANYARSGCCSLQLPLDLTLTACSSES